MYNALIHNPATVRSFIEKRGYRCIYLAPYSSFLNPIELFQLKINAYQFSPKQLSFYLGENGTLNLTLINPEAEIALSIDMVIALVFDTVATAREPFLDQALVRCT
ncbi:hypothetical protein RO3G_01021 [Rhizopus delemar RA 99-880]|uniref:Tc1-like transposase DDE domain-containing protein n=1 Tax=Rhizopus delemar (strain RA 99-880 / ATCC MYA-4621 / FGSC 9543 / NRRL 43880) TaxID=246409 RepID=I1BJD7_RHIO9|nr:hypothetical protein RO3G_01021 [Rhizopus delemar RA 99-880]|eukprot:EIE76317.1 hypothetical protein RO3G_01021 [Rhizopus delemar RA 99-880]